MIRQSMQGVQSSMGVELAMNPDNQCPAHLDQPPIWRIPLCK